MLFFGYLFEFPEKKICNCICPSKSIHSLTSEDMAGSRLYWIEEKTQFCSLPGEWEAVSFVRVVCLSLCLSAWTWNLKNHFARAVSIWAGPWKSVGFVWVSVARIASREGWAWAQHWCRTVTAGKTRKADGSFEFNLRPWCLMRQLWATGWAGSRICRTQNTIKMQGPSV